VSRRYPRRLVWLHWLTLTAVLAAVACVLGREWTGDRALRTLLLETHRQLGLLVFAGTVLRLAFRRMFSPLPAPLAEGLHLWAVHAAHAFLYLLLIGLPVLGVLATQASGHPVTLLGMPLVSIVERNRDLAEQITEVHEIGAWLLLALAGLHAAAAIWHHAVLRDDTLRRMLPLRWTKDTTREYPQ
jgi:cytochrome b561